MFKFASPSLKQLFTLAIRQTASLVCVRQNMKLDLRVVLCNICSFASLNKSSCICSYKKRLQVKLLNITINNIYLSNPSMHRFF